MRLPRRSISLWRALIYEASPPLCVRQNGTKPFTAAVSIFPTDTITWPPVFEIKMKLLHAFQRANRMGFAWQSSEAQGSELSGNLFVLIDPAQNSRSKWAR